MENVIFSDTVYLNATVWEFNNFIIGKVNTVQKKFV